MLTCVTKSRFSITSKSHIASLDALMRIKSNDACLMITFVLPSFIVFSRKTRVEIITINERRFTIAPAGTMPIAELKIEAIGAISIACPVLTV